MNDQEISPSDDGQMLDTPLSYDPYLAGPPAVPMIERAADPLARAALAELGSEVARLCAARGWSQHGLARRSGVSQSSISRLMSGKAPGMPLVTVVRIMAALDAHLVGSDPTTG